MDNFISYASNFEDVMLWRALKSASPGFYVDIGAHHPTIDSVTKAFYDRGWRGINVEPTRHLWELLVKERPRDINICAAAAATHGNVEFHDVVGTGLSTTDAETAERHRQAGYDVQTYQVPMLALSDIYEAHQITDVHFLKIDVEGSEEQVLLGAAFDRVRPWIVVVEATEPNTQIPTHERWEHILTKENFLPVYFDGVNRYYIDRNRQHLAEHFRAPPNVFDNFIQYRYWDAQLKCEQHARALEKAIQEILSSWSWRLTKLFRAPGILVRALIERHKK